MTCGCCGRAIDTAERTGVTFMGVLCSLSGQGGRMRAEEDYNAVNAQNDP